MLRRLRHALHVRLLDATERGAGRATAELREDLARQREATQALRADVAAIPGWEDSEHRAWSEYAERTGIAFAYEAFAHDHEQAVVVLR